MSKLSLGLMNQFGDALENAGYTPAHIDRMRSRPELLKNIKAVLNGVAEIVLIKHVIDLDADPFVPEDCTVEEHQKQGQFQWDPAKIQLFLSKKQQKGYIEGHMLRKELKGKPILNANILDYLFSHPELIPEEWKEKNIFFWGTIYRDSDGDLYVRYLYWGGGKWCWDYGWLVIDLRVSSPAAVLASK